MNRLHYLIVIGASLFNAIVLAMIKWMLNAKVSVISCFLLLQAAYLLSAFVIALGAYVYDTQVFTKITQDVCRVMTTMHVLAFVVVALLALVFTMMFLHVLSGENVSSLSSVQSVLTIVLLALIGTFVLGESLSSLELLALSLLVVGICLMGIAYSRR